MAASRKYYSHSKGCVAPRVPVSRQRCKSSELFDEVVSCEPSDVDAPPLPAEGRNTTWTAVQEGSGSGRGMKKKDLRCDDKISYRGAVYKCSPFCPSPVKTPTQSDSDEVFEAAGGGGIEMDTEEVIDSRSSSLAATLGVKTNTSALEDGSRRGPKRRGDKLKVFDFDELSDTPTMQGSKVNSSGLAAKTVSKPVSSSSSLNHRYSTIRDFAKRRVVLAGSRVGKVWSKQSKEAAVEGKDVWIAAGKAEKREDDLNAGASEVPAKMTKPVRKLMKDSLAREKRNRVVRSTGKDGTAVKNFRESRGSQAETKSGPALPEVGDKFSESSYPKPLSRDSNSSSLDPHSKANKLQSVISGSRDGQKVELASKSRDQDTTKPAAAGFASKTSDSSSSNVRQTGRRKIAAKMEDSSCTGSDILLEAEVNDSEARLVPDHDTQLAGGNSRDSRLERMDDKSKSLASSSTTTALPHPPNLRHSIKKRSDGDNMASRQGKVSTKRPGIAQRKSKPTTASADSMEVESAAGAPLPANVHGFIVKEAEDGDGLRVNGVWSKEEPNTFRSGKRKRAWIIESKSDEPSVKSDPYAFDFSDDSPSSSSFPQDSISQKLTEKKSNSKTLEPTSSSASTSGISRRVVPNCSSGSIPPKKKRGKDPKVDVLKEIDAMLEGYEEKGEQDDMRSRLSPEISKPPRARVSRLKKSNSEGRRGKQRQYAYTVTSVPSPGEEGVALPSMKKSLSWPKRSRLGAQMMGSPTLSTGHAQSMESGQTRQFYEEIHFLLDSMKPCRPAHTRCLSTCSLASQMLDSDFSRLVRAHDFTEKILSVLQDALDDQGLCVCAAVLLYIMTRDKMCVGLGEGGVTLLVGMLATPNFQGEELEGRHARDWEKVKEQARHVLEQVADKTTQGLQTPPPEEEEEELVPLSQATPTEDENEGSKESSMKKAGFRVATDEISVSELARECVISLSAPQKDPQWFREELRTRGALDHLANMVISSCEELSSLGGGKLDDISDESARNISRQADVLDRQLKSIEHLTLLNKSNQSYLVVFDGSILVSRLAQFVGVGHGWLTHEPLRLCGQLCLVSVLKVLINFTHDSDLGSHRLGEQRDIMTSVLAIVLKCPGNVPDSDKFDISIMALILIINLIENSTINCHRLESVSMETLARTTPEAAPSQRVKTNAISNGGVASRGLVLTALTELFLTLIHKADSAVIDVPTPQRLSQISSNSSPPTGPSPHGSQGSSPGKMAASSCKKAGETCKANLSNRLTGRVKGYSSPSDVATSSQNDSPHPLSQVTSASQVGAATSGRGGVVSDDEEECEPIEVDELVFDRDEYNSALNQAGRQMEDSLLSSYLALVLGIIAEKDFDMVDVIRNLMPSRSFSEMLKMLKQFVSFMSMTGSDVGLESIRHTIKYLEALEPSSSSS